MKISLTVTQNYNVFTIFLIQCLLSLVNSGEISGQRAVSSDKHPDGYWGKPSSTVDWCERNYQVTFYVAEFFNSISSFAMICCGLLGVLVHFKDLEERFFFAFISVVVVGIGSTAFHGTLWFSLQMLDELPMIYSALILAYCLIQHPFEKPRYAPWLAIAMVAHAIFTTLLVASPVIWPEYASPLLQFICFHVSFAILELFTLIKVGLMYEKETDKFIRKLYVLGLCLWCGAIGLWFADFHFCDTVWEGPESLRVVYLTYYGYTFPNPQFHAWWHVFASSGLYLLCVLVAHNRQLVLGKHAEVKFFYHIFPYVKVYPSKARHSMSLRKRTSSKKMDDGDDEKEEQETSPEVEKDNKKIRKSVR
jgi:dihydroceramidase